MRIIACLLSLVVNIGWGAMNLRQVARLSAGLYAYPGGLVCADTDHDSLRELVFNTGTSALDDPMRLEFWEYCPVNSYALVQRDTSIRYEPGFYLGNLIPHDAGDVDGDGLADIVGSLYEWVGPDFNLNIAVVESPTVDSHPRVVKWAYCYLRNTTHDPYFVYTDLDQDRSLEAVMAGPRVFECHGNDSLDLVWQPPTGQGYGGPRPAIGDFDLDGLTDVAGGFTTVHVLENAELGRDTYQLVYVDETGMFNGFDAFAGDDLDQDGKPEFFVAYWLAHNPHIDLWMWEMTGDNQYSRVLVERRPGMVTNWDCASRCGDIDGDGIEELVWASYQRLAIYKATGNNVFEQVWSWIPDLGTEYVLGVRLDDLNGNGYREVVASASCRTAVFEVEAVRIVYPDTAAALELGDTCLVRWRIYTPPRCDSVSLFLKTDTVVPTGERFWRLDTIATGLAPTESSYSWVVPDTQLAWAKVLAIAYGPGWQYDESDSAFSIIPSGLVDQPRVIVRDWALSVSPNPARGAFAVRYDVPRRCRVSVGVYDVDGRMVMSLAEGARTAGRYQVMLPPKALPAGVYFVRLESGDSRISRKVVLVSQ